MDGAHGRGRLGRRRDRARGQRHVERDAAVHRRTGRRPRGALRRPVGATRVAAVPGVPRVRPRAATEGHADRRRAHRRAGAGGAHPRDRPRVARFAVPPHAPRRRHRAVRHPAVHDGRLVVRRRARRPAQARARGGARAGTAARADAGAPRSRVPRPPAVRRQRARPAPRVPAVVLRLGAGGTAGAADRADLRRARQDPAARRTDRPELGRQPHRQHDVPRLRAGRGARLGDGRPRARRDRRGVG